MAAIVVEDGTLVSGANSYISEAELTTYATDRGVTISGTNNILLIQAMDYLESKNFKGDKYTSTQSLVFPRIGLDIDGFSVSTTTIPQLLKDALAEIAIGIDGGVNPLSNLERETIREKVDVIEVEYSKTAFAKTMLTAAETKLNKLLKPLGLSHRI